MVEMVEELPWWQNRSAHILIGGGIVAVLAIALLLLSNQGHDDWRDTLIEATDNPNFGSGFGSVAFSIDSREEAVGFVDDLCESYRDINLEVVPDLVGSSPPGLSVDLSDADRTAIGAMETGIRGSCPEPFQAYLDAAGWSSLTGE